MNLVTLIAIYAVPVIIAITLHEAAHGFVAWRCGDDTAYRMGRVTFNPLRHIDPFGTILLPALLLLSGTRLLFGWAKPVPVNFLRLNHPRRDMVLVAAAGPGIPWPEVDRDAVVPLVPADEADTARRRSAELRGLLVAVGRKPPASLISPAPAAREKVATP